MSKTCENCAYFFKGYCLKKGEIREASSSCSEWVEYNTTSNQELLNEHVIRTILRFQEKIENEQSD
jgi:hypothetical protein